MPPLGLTPFAPPPPQKPSPPEPIHSPRSLSPTHYAATPGPQPTHGEPEKSQVARSRLTPPLPDGHRRAVIPIAILFGVRGCR